MEKVQSVLHNELGECEECPQLAVMRTVARQFHKRQPRWWVANNEIVVPIWMVEVLQKKRDL